MPKTKEVEITDKRKLFLLLFTRELAINSSSEFSKLQEIYDKEKEKEKHETVYVPQTNTSEKSKLKEKVMPITTPVPVPSPRPHFQRKQTIPPQIKQEQKKPVEMIKSSEEGNESMAKSILSEIPKPVEKKPAESPKPAIQNSQKPKPVPNPKPEEGLNVVGPVRIKPQTREISDNSGRTDYPILRIPQTKLPEQFQYLKPVPTGKEIDLGKLNPLANDINVQTIECEGPERPIMVTGGMGRKPTAIKLSDMEIEEVIRKFSDASKIPIEVGVFKVVVGRFIFSAIISEVVPSRFFIRKMTNQHPNQNEMQRKPNQQ